MLLIIYSAQDGPPKAHLTLNISDAEVRKRCPEVVGAVMGHQQGAKEAQSGPSTQSEERRNRLGESARRKGGGLVRGPMSCGQLGE